VAYVTQQSRPRFLFGERLAADIASDFGVGPHGGGMDEIVEGMASEFEALRFEDGYFYRWMERARHWLSLLVCARDVKAERSLGSDVFGQRAQGKGLRQSRTKFGRQAVTQTWSTARE